ncbi:MAG: hypothetical protein AB1486_23755 [Planctomycetota bacterium]
MSRTGGIVALRTIASTFPVTVGPDLTWNGDYNAQTDTYGATCQAGHSPI